MCCDKIPAPIAMTDEGWHCHPCQQEHSGYSWTMSIYPESLRHESICETCQRKSHQTPSTILYWMYTLSLRCAVPMYCNTFATLCQCNVMMYCNTFAPFWGHKCMIAHNVGIGMLENVGIGRTQFWNLLARSSRLGMQLDCTMKAAKQGGCWRPLRIAL